MSRYWYREQILEAAKAWLTENHWHEGDSPEEEALELREMLDSGIIDYLVDFGLEQYAAGERDALLRVVKDLTGLSFGSARDSVMAYQRKLKAEANQSEASGA